jgi:hypothetical protein
MSAFNGKTRPSTIRKQSSLMQFIICKRRHRANANIHIHTQTTIVNNPGEYEQLLYSRRVNEGVDKFQTGRFRSAAFTARFIYD